MLTSSDAKFRCLWHMFIWSILLTLVSQFYVLSDHIAFYIFGSMCILVLPIITSLYSNTAGRRGAGLLRVSYVLCDPVIACMALVPVLLINRLTPLIREMECLSQDIHSWNESLACLREQAFSTPSKLQEKISTESLPFRLKTALWLERRQFLTAIELSVIIPCILALLMGRRTRKMNNQTSLLIFLYWLVGAIECCGMLEASVLCGSDRMHYAVTTEVTVAVACILANSYGLVTLCSYLSPIQCKGDKEQIGDHFDLVYKCVVGVLGVAFVELPQLIARLQMIVATSDRPSTFEINSFIKENKGGFMGGIVDGSYTSRDSFKHTAVAFSDLSVNKSTSLPPNIHSFLKNVLLKLGQNASTTIQPTLTTANSTTLFPSTDSLIPTTTESIRNFDKFYRQGLPTSFYLWAFKDAIMIFIIITLLILQRLGRGTPAFMKVLGQDQGCVGTVFDNLNTVFMPEKRDEYIITRCAKCKQIDLTDGTPRHHKNHYRSITHSKSSRPASRQTSHNTFQQSSKPSTSAIVPLDKQKAETSFSYAKSESARADESLLYETDDFKFELNGELRDKMNILDELGHNDMEVENPLRHVSIVNEFTEDPPESTSTKNVRNTRNYSVDNFSRRSNPLVNTKDRFYSLDEGTSKNKRKKSVKFSFS